ADAADVAYELGSEFLAQRVDVDFDRVAFYRIAPAVELVLELRARQDRSGAREQGLQQRELAGRQRQRLAFEPRLAGGRVELDIARRKRPPGAAGAAPQQRAKPRGELVQVEWFDDVIVGAGIQPRDPIGDRIARREDQYGPRVAALAHRAQYLEPRTPGQSEVQDHRVMHMLGERKLGRAAVLDQVNRETILAQAVTDAGADHRIVFGEQYAHQLTLPKERSQVDRERRAAALTSFRT